MSSSIFFNIVFESLYRWINAAFNAGKSSSPFFSGHHTIIIIIIIYWSMYKIEKKEYLFRGVYINVTRIHIFNLLYA